MVVSYIHFLQYQLQTESNTRDRNGKKVLGILADQFHSISDDFDDTPACFEDYL